MPFVVRQMCLTRRKREALASPTPEGVGLARANVSGFPVPRQTILGEALVDRRAIRDISSSRFERRVV